MVLRWALSLALLAAVLILPVALRAESQGLGADLYLHGTSSEGRPVQAHRDKENVIQGKEAACVNCHRRSGLGGQEGRVFIPPVAGPYLFHLKVDAADEAALPYVESFRPNRPAYDEATLARAIRNGVGADGRELSYLMPRYEMSDTELATLTGYLKNLGYGRVPGVEDAVLHFATIVTPDADPRKREAFLAVINEFFSEKNAHTRALGPRVRSNRVMMARVNRAWKLHLWELSGPRDTWEAQLAKRMHAEPVFAVLSGLGGKDWGPIQRFCDERKLPCLFPNVDAPDAGSNNGYSLYFSEGVLLEAGLIARDLERRLPGAKALRVVQVYRAGSAGDAAAGALSTALKGSGVTVDTRAIEPGGAPADVSKAVGAVGEADVLVLWLAPDDLAALGPATRAVAVYASAVMGGADNPPIPAEWRAGTRFAYPYDTPERRRVPVDFALGWFRIRKIPVVEQRIQADTLLACGLLAESLEHMVDAFFRDYLIEKLEGMIGRRTLTGYYRHLSLGPGQRIASKGGYIVRFGDKEKSKGQLIADSEWVVP